MGFRTLSARLFAVRLCLLSTLSPHARASPLPNQLELEVTVCEASALDVTDARRAIDAEFASDGVRSLGQDPDRALSQAQRDVQLSVSIDCDAELTTYLWLKSTRTGRERRRSIVLADVDRAARARALALAVSEFVRSDWPDVTALEAEHGTPSRAAYPDAGLTPEGAPEQESAQQAGTLAPPTTTGSAPVALIPTPRGDSAESNQRRPLQRPPLALAASARLRWFVDYSSVNWGADVGSDIGALRLRAEALFSSTSDRLGSASLGSAAVCVGYRVLDTQLGPFAISGYPLLSAGATWMRGSPARQTVATDPTTGAYGDLRFLLESRLDRAHFSPSLAAEVGRASGLVARAGERVLGATGGFFVGLSAGASY